MTIHPEDAESYAVQLHDDCERIAKALERIAVTLEDVTSSGRVNVACLVVTREDRP